MLQGAVLGRTFYYLHINYMESGIERSHHLPGRLHWITLCIKGTIKLRKGLIY